MLIQFSVLGRDLYASILFWKQEGHVNWFRFDELFSTLSLCKTVSSFKRPISTTVHDQCPARLGFAPAHTRANGNCHLQ